jgi:hypothetical protein
MKFLLPCLLFMLGNVLHAQQFPDTIHTTKGHYYACRVTHIDAQRVHYVPAVLRKYNRKGKIRKIDITSLSLHSDVPIEGWVPQRDPYIGKTFQWKEDDGIIYAELHDRAPQLGNGLATISTLLERHVRVTARDHQIFGGAAVTMLLKLYIDGKGDLLQVTIQEHASVRGTEGTLTRYIEEEILNVVSQMKPWRPATTNGVEVPCRIYMPLKFIVNTNALQMLPSKFAYSFKGRR